jgi:hypothetical protein
MNVQCVPPVVLVRHVHKSTITSCAHDIEMYFSQSSTASASTDRLLKILLLLLRQLSAGCRRQSAAIRFCACQFDPAGQITDRTERR